MSLRGALVDSAVIQRRSASGAKVYGETPHYHTYSTPFRCRISKPKPFERTDSNIKFPQYERDLILICGVNDDNGEQIDMSAAEEIVVDEGLFAGEYEIVGKPSVIRKKRKQIGWEVELKEKTGKDPE